MLMEWSNIHDFTKQVFLDGRCVFILFHSVFGCMFLSCMFCIAEITTETASTTSTRIAKLTWTH